jgi:DNA polymerase-3 subunit alpha
MEIAKEIGGFSPAEADDLRKAIGKKIHALMASLKEQVHRGLRGERHRRPGRRTQLWDDNFEKPPPTTRSTSHAACYALIAYRTAWLQGELPGASTWRR